MSDLKTKAPEVGKGSPAGMRYFFSKYAELVCVVTPEHYAHPETGEKRPHLRVAFEKRGKPDVLVGDGYLGSRNKSGSDTNASPYYGVFAVMDPGPDPKTDEEKQNRLIIDHLRKTEHYKKTHQDNQLQVTARLKELNWDPSILGGPAGSRFIKAGGSVPISRPDLDAPQEQDIPEAPKTKTPAMGRKAQAAA